MNIERAIENLNQNLPALSRQIIRQNLDMSEELNQFFINTQIVLMHISQNGINGGLSLTPGCFTTGTTQRYRNYYPPDH